MYLREIHAENNIPTLYQFIKENPLGLLTTALDSNTFHFLQSSHIPWVLDNPDGEGTTELGTLRGHIARANPQAKSFIEAAKEARDGLTNADGSYTLTRDVLVIFNGPAHHYVTPKFYTETKPATGKVVPTWNYSAVQVYGRATIFYETKADSTHTFLNKQIRDLTNHNEVETMGNKENPWAVEDAPESYIEILKKAIIGIQIKISDIGGKWKMSQESTAGDQEGVINGFAKLDTELGKEMSETVKASVYACLIADSDHPGSARNQTDSLAAPHLKFGLAWSVALRHQCDRPVFKLEHVQ
ncbi:transcriptional regulator [Paraphaeosphaeria sporulosa]